VFSADFETERDFKLFDLPFDFFDFLGFFDCFLDRERLEDF